MNEVVEGPVQESRIAVEPSESFVVTPTIERMFKRALAYLEAGYPVHFSGPAGTGKTTMALHVAALRGRPVVLMHGDDEFGSSDLIGSESGYRKSRVVDNFIHSVLKTEESVDTVWSDNRLTLACKRGDTLVYDEFTRSKPEANNSLLSALEEKLLSLPRRRSFGDGFLEVDPEFRAIFTSNPEEYAGVHRTQDALLDRLITIKLDYPDRDTEVAITRAKSGVSLPDAEVIVDLVREVRQLGATRHGPSLRACIMVGRIAAQEGARVSAGDSLFRDICHDVLSGQATKVARGGETNVGEKLDEFFARLATRGHSSRAKGQSITNEVVTPPPKPGKRNGLSEPTAPRKAS